MARGLGCSAGRGIFLDQGSNPCLLHWMVDSLPLSHQRSPPSSFYSVFKICLESIFFSPSSLLLYYSKHFNVSSAPPSPFSLPCTPGTWRCFWGEQSGCAVRSGCHCTKALSMHLAALRSGWHQLAVYWLTLIQTVYNMSEFFQGL